MKTTIKTSVRETTLHIDVHKKHWQVAVPCDGIALGNISIEASVELLVKHLLCNSLQRSLSLPTDKDLQQSPGVDCS